MGPELDDLVEFLHHGNTQIRQTAADHLVGFSLAQPSIFKTNQLLPIKYLKLLVKDYTPIAKNAVTMLINLSNDQDILANLATDDTVLEDLLFRITSSKEPNANEMCMLLANLAKHDSLKRILNLNRILPHARDLSTSRNALDQLMDCFVKGADGAFNKFADYDYLSYLFADLAKFPEGRAYFDGPRRGDSNVIPMTKLIVFTEHTSDIRRRGVASVIKNVCFDVDRHAHLIALDGVNLLPYVLLPVMGSEEYDDEDMEGMLDDLQLLPPDKEREKDVEILKTHLDTILLLTTTRGGRDVLRNIKVYPIVRETHLHVEDEGVRDGCDRIVQIIMAKEEGEEDAPKSGFAQVNENEDEMLLEV